MIDTSVENLHSTLPVFLLYSHTVTILTTPLTPVVWGFFPHQAILQHQCGPQFNSILIPSTCR